MIFNYLLFITLFTFISKTNIHAQSKLIDSLSLKKKGENEFKPIPHHSTFWGIIPGGGQIYNKDYCKAPIVYIALIASFGTIATNNIKYRSYLDSYFSLYDLREYAEDAITGNTIKNPKFGKQINSKTTVRVYNWLTTSHRDIEGVTIDQIKRNKTLWRRYKNLSIIATALVYSLSIIEANVSAHLKFFDISEDLTLKIYPNISQPPFLSKPISGITLVVNIK